MFVAVDDTDSRNGRCTTFLATEMIRRIGLDLIGYPRLVRLNPAVPWKTRGNAALVMEFGHGIGNTRKIGDIGGDVLSYERSHDEPDIDDVMEALIPILMENREDDSSSGLIVSAVRPRSELYTMGVRTILSKDIIEKELNDISARTFTVGDGMGLIGAACGMAWVPGDSTFELLAYRSRERWGKVRHVEPSSIREMDRIFQTTFNSWEERFQKVTMVPSTPCPILYGIRGDDDDELELAHHMIVSEGAERWVTFLTNQGTDDHLISDAMELIPDRSYTITGTIAENARHIKGGHVFIDMDTSYGRITCGIYEPAKEFRQVFDSLIPGDTVMVMGELRSDPRTLNVEKVNVLTLAENVVRSPNPKCPSCGRSMKSIGSGQGYRCRPCGMKTKTINTETIRRDIVTGWYEPPAAARRHLSKPLKRIGIEQPIEFVNRRME